MNQSVMVFPVSDPAGWAEFAREVESGDRAEAHKEFLRRVGVTRELNYLQQLAPDRYVIVAIWEGLGPAESQNALQELVEHPQSPHEEYIAHVVVPTLHGVEESDWVAPEIELVSVVDTRT